MIAAWMLYALLVGVLASGGALVLETLLRAHRRGTRWVWAGAALLSVVWPAVHLFLETRPEPVVPVPPDPRWVVALEPLTVQVGPRSVLHALDGPLLWVWILATVLLLTVAVFVVARTYRLRKGWRGERAAGCPVLLSEDWGPAVVGFFKPQIVLPDWCRDLEEDALKLIVDHETEHLRAGDLPLLLMASLLPLLMPWHLVLWWQVARLRVAAEADCDLRVLRKHPHHARSYMELLLEVGRRPPRRELVAAMLSEPEETLARRIRIMTMPFPRKPWVRGLILAGIGGVLVALACWAPAPMGIDEDSMGPEDVASVTLPQTPEEIGAVETLPPPPDAVTETDVSAAPAFTPFTSPPNITNRAEVVRALESEYPPLLKGAGIGGTVNVWFYLDESGAVRRTLLDQSSGHQALDDAALRVANSMTFTAALNQDKAVPVWISLPITFATSDGEAGPKTQTPTAVESPERSLGAAPTFTPYTVRPDIKNRSDVARALEREYPPLLRAAGIGGTALVWFFIDEDGVVRRTLVDNSSGHQALDEAAQRVAELIQFTPALNEGDPVPVWISLPITFTTK